MVDFADHVGREDADTDTERPADGRQNNRFDDELGENHQRCRADGHAKADLLDALGNGDEHDVHDADAAHEERNRRDRREENRHQRGDGPHRGHDLLRVADLEVVVLIVGQIVPLAKERRHLARRLLHVVHVDEREVHHVDGTELRALKDASDRRVGRHHRVVLVLSPAVRAL